MELHIDGHQKPCVSQLDFKPTDYVHFTFGTLDVHIKFLNPKDGTIERDVRYTYKEMRKAFFTNDQIEGKK